MASRMPESGENRDVQTDGGQAETQQTGGGAFGGNMFLLLILILLMQQGKSAD